MRESWELLTAGPPDADRSVLFLPGGANAARSFDLVMADPALSGVRLVATTLPGMAGAPVSEDVSIHAMARRAGELATEHRCDVVVGFSHGATVALDMVLSGHFTGPGGAAGHQPDALRTRPGSSAPSYGRRRRWAAGRWPACSGSCRSWPDLPRHLSRTRRS